ncbi:MAG: molybdopterin-dependent oxidoreductase [Nitrospiria bacterium]
MRTLKKVGRRQFLRKFLLCIATLIISVLKPFSESLRSAQARLNFWRASEYVGKTREGRYKKFYIQYYKPFRRIEGDRWRLKVTGLCETPQEFTLEALKELPRIRQISRIKCVECWSAKAEWEGFSIFDLEKAVRPHPEVLGIVFHCADTYVEYLSLEEMHHDRAMLVHTMNQKPISDEHGFPLRVIIPFKYGYKSPKAILELEFVDRFKRGTWTQIGPYSSDGTILPGYDHPLDQGKKRRRIFGGEIID